LLIFIWGTVVLWSYDRYTIELVVKREHLTDMLFRVHILLLIISHDDGSWVAYSNTGMRQFRSETGNTPPFIMHN